MSNNPFTTAYQKIIEALTASDDVTAIVAASNIVRLDTEYMPLIDDRNTGDLPALILMPVPGGSRNLHSSSSSASFELNFELIYQTDKELLAASAGLFALDWAVCKAFLAAMPRFNETKNIVKFELGEWSPLSPFENDESQELGWTSSLGISVHLNVCHSEM